ncbi:hypothetical protein EDC96DRAFT_579487 [Choanephora cucurbitarum]|nr:hypothetical protein EDC96DRAFT_579487 [Choanephora cucurbitarum]
MKQRTTLFVSGFDIKTRARNLAYEFERYGRLVRLDIPAPKNYNSKPYAFVEFETNQDAEDAYQEMNGRTIDGYTLSIQWARTTPAYLQNHQRSYPKYNRDNRSRSPYRRERSPSSPPRYDNAIHSVPHRRMRSRSRSPSGYQRRYSQSPPIN